MSRLEKLNLVRSILTSPLFLSQTVDQQQQTLDDIIKTGEVSREDVYYLINEAMAIQSEAQNQAQNQTRSIQQQSRIIEIKGNPNVRQKIQTKQIQNKAQSLPKGKKSAGRGITAKEKEYMLAKRRQTFGGENIIIPKAPTKRLQPLSSEEVSQRHVNKQVNQPLAANIVIPLNRIILPDKYNQQGQIKVPHEYQLRVVRHIMGHRGLIAVHSVGSGKTLIAAIATISILNYLPNFRVFFIGPKSVLTNFERTLADNFQFVDWSRISFYTYEKFQIDQSKGLIDCNNTFMVIDEAHRLRTASSRAGKTTAGKTAQAVLECAHRATKVLLLTATPVVNKPYDIVNLVSIIRGDVKPMDEKVFNSTIISKKGVVINPQAFTNYFYCTTSIFVRPQDETYPTVTRHEVRIPMSAKYYQEYQRVESQEISQQQLEVLGESDLEPFYNGVRRTVNADIEELNSKLDWVRNHLLQYNNRKMVIFSPFISLGVRQLERLTQDFYVRPVIAEITGDNTTQERQQVIDDYNNDRVQILLISIGAGGLGIDLRGTRDVVIMQPGWNEVEMAQAEGRAIRFHSHTYLPLDQRHVDVWILLLVKPPYSPPTAKPSIDEIILGIINRKNQVLHPFMQLLTQVSIENMPC